MKIRGDKVWDRSRGTWIALTPEEDVRQWFVDWLIEQKNIDATRIATEYTISIARRNLRVDIAIFAARSTSIIAIVECKAPSVALDEQTLRQVTVYNSQIGAKYIILTNGKNTLIYDTTSSQFVEDALLII